MKQIQLLSKLTFIVAVLLMVISCQPKVELTMPLIFSDNMVLQQNRAVNIWGKGHPNSKVLITAGWGMQSEAVVKADSSWTATLSTIEAGGPYKVTISSGKQKIELKNILLGEVWLASGQSNMAMPMAGWPPNDSIEHSAATIENSVKANIRMFTVQRNVSASPLSELEGSWKLPTIENTGEFSATATFFALKLYEELNVPIGIIHSSYGGSPIEAWISNDMLSIDTDFKEITSDLKKQEERVAQFNNWLLKLKSFDIETSENSKTPYKELDVFDSYFTNPELETSDWGTIRLPGTIEESEIGPFDGVVWLQKTIVIPTSWEGKELSLNLGAIDDMDVTYFNGEKIGGHEEIGHWQTKRSYAVGSEKVKPGVATITIKLIDAGGIGGFIGDSSEMIIHPTHNSTIALSLAGKWKYKVAAEIRNESIYLLDPLTNDYNTRPKSSVTLTLKTPTALYNAMIAPLLPYTIKGVIWYQGEANVEKANQYMRLTSMLTTDWRNRFGNEVLPFYYVQLAPWHYQDENAIASANLREAQRRMLYIPHSGMAVTLDIGDVNNIHPAKKREVGERLALWALNHDYDKEISYSGPLLRDKEIKENKIMLSFDFAEDGLEIKKDVPNQFEVSDASGKFYAARTVVEEDKIVVFSPNVKNPVDVRYAYKNGSKASLFNSAGLPSPSFTTEDEIME